LPTTLDRCPFCGSFASMKCHGSIFPSGPGYRVECEGKCHAMTCYWHTLDEARDHWNMRVPLHATVN